MPATSVSSSRVRPSSVPGGGRGRDGASGSRARASSEAGGGNSRKPKEACLWKAWPPQECEACLQTTHQVDRDSLPEDPVWVKWSKMNPVVGRKGKVPSGGECTNCFYCRRSFDACNAMFPTLQYFKKQRKTQHKKHLALPNIGNSIFDHRGYDSWSSEPSFSSKLPSGNVLDSGFLLLDLGSWTLAY